MKTYSVILTEEQIEWLSLHIPVGAVVPHFVSAICDGIHEALANKQYFGEVE